MAVKLIEKILKLFQKSGIMLRTHKELQIQLDSILADLNLDFIDICLIHWPFSWLNNIDFPSTAEDVLDLDKRIIELWTSLIKEKIKVKLKN